MAKPKKPPVRSQARKPQPRKPAPRKPPVRRPAPKPRPTSREPIYAGSGIRSSAPAPQAAPAPAPSGGGSSGGGPARQIYNPGGAGQDARYDIRGLPEVRPGVYSDGVYEYDANGLALNRPSTFVEGLKPADQMDGDQWGDYLAGGGASGGGGGAGGGIGGSVIPGAGTYLYEQAMAQGAYDKAIAALKTQRRQRQVAAGLGDDWKVDPLAMYGGYQQMLRGQGIDLDAAEAQAMERGLQGAGLGRQAEGLARYGHAVQNLGFRSQLSDWENEYQSGISNAEMAKQQAMMESLMDAYGDAYGNWGGDYGGGGDQPITSYASSVKSALGIPARTKLPTRPVPKNVPPKPRFSQQQMRIQQQAARRPTAPRPPGFRPY